MVSSSAMAPVTKLKAHTESLLCCHSSVSSPRVVATSSQDGTVCLFDLRTKDMVQRFECFGHEAVTSICFSPAGSEVLYAAAGMSIYCMDVRVGPLGRELEKYNFNTEEINQVALNQKANFLAAADDSGEIKVIDLQNHKLQKTLRGIHTNICSTVQFHPNKPWELFSGGLDAKIVKWDFCKGRPLKVIDQGASAASGASRGMISGQIYNPPFVHVLSTPENKLSGEAARLMAVAKGDGVVEICDFALENWQELQLHGIKSRNFNQNKSSKGKVLQQVEIVQSIDATAVGGHTAAVSCITFARFSETGSIVVSGSNDRSIKLWTWNKKDMKASSSSSSTSIDRGPMTLSINHRKKVNWLCTSATSSENLFVADTSRVLTVYTVL